MAFVLGIDHVNRTSSPDHYVRREVPEGTMSESSPPEREDRLAQAPHAHLGSRQRCFPPCHGLDVRLPKAIQRELPSDAILLAAAAKAALVDDPRHSLQTLPQGVVYETAACQAAEPVPARHRRWEITEEIEDPLCDKNQRTGDDVQPADDPELIPNPLNRPSNLAAKKRIRVQIRKATRQS